MVRNFKVSPILATIAHQIFHLKVLRFVTNQIIDSLSASLDLKGWHLYKIELGFDLESSGIFEETFPRPDPMDYCAISVENCLRGKKLHEEENAIG